MWTFIVAASWLVLERSDSSAWVGVITFAGMIPFLLVSPIAGLLADRLDRRNLTIFTFLGNAAITALAAGLTIASVIELWHVAILALANGVFRATQEPAVQALIPNQVPKEDLLNAITLNATTRHGARFFGLLVASPLLAISYIGIPGVLVLSTVFQLAGCVLMSRTHTASTGEILPSPEYDQSRMGNLLGGIFAPLLDRIIKPILEGMVYIYTNKAIAIFMILVVFHCSLVMSFESILPIFSRESLGAIDGSYLGYLVMAFGVGSLIGNLLLAGVRNEKHKGQLFIWIGVLSGVTPAILAFSLDITSSLAISALMGATQATFMALSSTYVQTVAPDRLRGRISSLYILHAGGIMAFANLAYGILADKFSAPPILFLTGIAFILIVILLSIVVAEMRRVWKTGNPVGIEQAT